MTVELLGDVVGVALTGFVNALIPIVQFSEVSDFPYIEGLFLWFFDFGRRGYGHFARARRLSYRLISGNVEK